MTRSLVPLAPRSPLAGFVRSVGVVSRAADARSYVRLPDGEVELVVRIAEHDGEVHAIGTRKRALYKVVDEVTQAIVVRFKPGGAYPFFGVPMSALTDRVVSLSTLWGSDGARTIAALVDAPTVAARLRVLEDALADRLRRGDVFEPASAALVRRAVRAITEAPDLPRVDALARAHGVSARHLRRAFDDVVGVGPKVFARIVRFQRALGAAERVAVPDWGAIAGAAGYYDQAHLIADFRAFAGTTPGAFARARRTAMNEASVETGVDGTATIAPQ